MQWTGITIVSPLKSVALLIIFALTLPTTAFSQQSDFDRASEHLRDMNIDRAMELYREIEQQGYRSGPLFYNMGLASFYRDSLGLAKSYFLQAADFPETREPSVEALAYLEEQFDRRSAVLPPLPWERLTDRLLPRPGPRGVLAIALLLFNIAVILRIITWQSARYLLALRVGSWTSLSLSILLTFTALYLERYENRYQSGVIIDSRAEIYQAPDTETSALGTAHEGYSVRVDGQRSREHPEWIYVRLQNGMSGWMQNSPARIF